MELQEHEVICAKCDGEVGVDVCPKCGGEGKLDWVSNAMSGKKDSLYHDGSTILGVTANSDVTFYHEGTESIKLTKDGFYVKGKKVKEDVKIYDAFVDFLQQAGVY